MLYKFFSKISAGANTPSGAIKSDPTPNQRPSDFAAWQLAEELHTSDITKFEKWKIYLPSKDNISRADLADIQLISQFNKGIHFLKQDRL